MNAARGRTLAGLALAATAGVPLLILLVRMRFVTFRDDFTGFNALGFILTWSLALLVVGAALGGAAWHVDRRSWLTRCAFGVNAVLLAALGWLLFTLR